MIIRSVPKSSLFRNVSAKFVFDYQNAGINAGKYVCINSVIPCLRMKPNTVYLIESVSIAGSIPETVFVDSLNAASFLSFELRRYQKLELITTEPVLISQYYKEKPISFNVGCNRGEDGINLKINGILNQVAETVGLSSISLAISLSSYEIDGTLYNTAFRDKEF